MAVLELLRQARVELAAAGDTCRLIEAGREAAREAEGHTYRAFAIEMLVAERRCELWAARIRELEERADRLGLRL